MKAELQKELVEGFPQFFQDINLPPTQTCMCWGCECGDGWFGILKKLCEDIATSDPPEGFKFSQVKEKFGGLRVYTFGGTEQISQLIHGAQKESYKTCEECGGKEDVLSDWICGWVRTLCKSCAANRFGEDAEKLWNQTEPLDD